MKEKKNIPFSIIILLLGTFITGALITYMLLNWAKPTGWILSTNGTDLSQLTWEETRYIRNLLRNGNVFTQSDLLENFVTYYHTLITILITIMLFLAGLLTYNFYKSRKEYNELMGHELRKFLDSYERLIENNSDTNSKEELEQFEYLQKWVKNYMIRVLEASDDTLINIVLEAVLEALFANDKFWKALQDKN